MYGREHSGTPIAIRKATIERIRLYASWAMAVLQMLMLCQLPIELGTAGSMHGCLVSACCLT